MNDSSSCGDRSSVVTADERIYVVTLPWLRIFHCWLSRVWVHMLIVCAQRNNTTCLLQAVDQVFVYKQGATISMVIFLRGYRPTCAPYTYNYDSITKRIEALRTLYCGNQCVISIYRYLISILLFQNDNIICKKKHYPPHKKGTVRHYYVFSLVKRFFMVTVRPRL